MLDIFIDGDSCPVKEEAARVAGRYALQVHIVSNRGLRVAMGSHVKGILVGDEFDAADNWIVEHAGAGDIVITADIQLASRCLKKSARALSPAGHIFTVENIGSALAMRELNAHLRETGESKGHNPAFSRNSRSRFLQSMDLLIQNLRRENKTRF